MFPGSFLLRGRIHPVLAPLLCAHLVPDGGAIKQNRGYSVAHAHLRHINPFPGNLRDLLSCYKRVVVPEMNGGQLAFMLRGRFALNIQSYPKLHARPFKINEIVHKIEELLG